MGLSALPLLSAAALLLPPLAQSQSAPTCGWASPSLGSSFDMSETWRSPAQTIYQVKDERASSTTYYFNPCDNVPMPNPACNGTSISGAPATGWQVESKLTRPSTCYRLGNDKSLGWNYSIYDINYPNRGVVMTYLFGDNQWCPQVPGGGGALTNRTLSLEFTCDPTIDPKTANYAAGVMVREENTCDYRVFIPSMAGCPLQCRTGGSLCSGNGVCGYNTDAQRSQCFCYGGFSGAMCETSNKAAGLSVEGILLIIVCLMLAGVVGLILFMFLRLRKLTVDPAAYESLQGRFNELGMVA